MSKYTKFCAGHNAELLNLLIRTKMTQNLARLVPKFRGEIEYLVATEFPECKGRSYQKKEMRASPEYRD